MPDYTDAEVTRCADELCRRLAQTIRDMVDGYDRALLEEAQARHQREVICESDNAT